MPPIKKTFSNSTNTFAPIIFKIAPKNFQLAHNFNLIAPNIYKIAPRKYEVAPINKCPQT